jgi:hypothetical protein
MKRRVVFKGLMPAGAAILSGAGTAVASTRSASQASSLVVGIKDRQLALDLFAAALFTFNCIILLTHGTDDFEFLLAGFANIFVDGHVGYTLF